MCRYARANDVRFIGRFLEHANIIPRHLLHLPPIEEVPIVHPPNLELSVSVACVHRDIAVRSAKASYSDRFHFQSL